MKLKSLKDFGEFGGVSNQDVVRQQRAVIRRLEEFRGMYCKGCHGCDELEKIIAELQGTHVFVERKKGKCGKCGKLTEGTICHECWHRVNDVA